MLGTNAQPHMTVCAAVGHLAVVEREAGLQRMAWYSLDTKAAGPLLGLRQAFNISEPVYELDLDAQV